MNAPLLPGIRLQLPRDYRVTHADANEREAALSLRRAVFCEEQGLFDGNDADAVDAHALTMVARPWLPSGDDTYAPVVGTVRIHQRQAGLWQGSRLAVAQEFRRIGAIGGALIQLAVRSAQTIGCERFIAQVQAANVRLFQRLHWHSVGTETLHGHCHHLMEADLAHYPPFAPGAALQVEVHRGRT